MTQRERLIGLNLREFRKGIKWSQAKFAEQIGITRDQLANIESGSTPMRYEIAWRIRDAFGLSIDWLWGGDMPPDDLSEDRPLPLPNSPRVGENALLTDVFNWLYSLTPRETKKDAQRIAPKAVHLSQIDIHRRAVARMFLDGRINIALPSVPFDYVMDFANQSAAFMQQYISKFPTEPPDLVNARAEALLWEKMASEIARRLVKQKGAKMESKVSLDTIVAKEDNGPVQHKIRTLGELVRHLQTITAERGAKAALARKFKVSRQAVDQWLSGDSSPSAEIALQLQHLKPGELKK